MTEAFWIVLVPAGIVATLAAMFARMRPEWSRRRRVLTSALPVPVVVASLCCWVLFRVMTAPAARCGVDACGMASIVALAGLTYAALVFGIGAVIAAWIGRRMARA